MSARLRESQAKETPQNGPGPAAAGLVPAPVAPARAGAPANEADARPITVTIDAGWLRQNGPDPYLLDQGDATYVLSVDVRTAGTAFVVAAPNIVLDLNQHVVTYGNAPAPVVANGGFEQGSGPEAPGWNLTAAPTASLAPSRGLHLYGNQVLHLANFGTTQTIVSAPIAIPRSNRQYTATITPAHSGRWETKVKLSVIDDVTGQFLAAGEGSAYRGYSAVATFHATATHAVRLRVDATPPAGQADSLDLDYASLTASFDYGVLASDLWSGSLPGYANLPAAVQGRYRSARNFSIRNGFIAQGEGRGYGSGPLYAVALHGLTVDNLRTHATGMDVSSLSADYATGSITVRNSTFAEDIDNISNRMRDYATLEFNHTAASILVEDNQILGSPQVGIMLSCNDPQYPVAVRHNTIKQDAVVANAYGILIAALRNFTIADNTITPTSGRGILIDGWGSPVGDGRIHGNDVRVQEHPNREYASLQARALRLRNGATGVHRDLDIYDNTFAAIAGPGMADEAYGARISYGNPKGEMNDSHIRLHNNTFRAVVTSPEPRFHADALLIDGVDAGVDLAVAHNVLESNDASLALSGPEAGDVFDLTLQSNTLSKAGDGAPRPYTGIVVGYGNHPVQNVSLIDMLTANGATADIVFRGSGPKSVAGGWLLEVAVKDAAGSPAPGATVDVFDASGAKVATGATGEDGRLQDLVLVTTTRTQAGADARAAATTRHAPFTVVAASGPRTAKVAIKPAANVAVQLILR
jgi:hypothetical protein